MRDQVELSRSASATDHAWNGQPTARCGASRSQISGYAVSQRCSIAAVVEHFPAKSSGMLAVRAWFYLPQPLIHFDSVITVFGSPNHHITVDADDTEHWTVTENGTAGADHHSPAIAVQNTWVCVEVNYTFAPPTITLYLGDVPILDEAAVDTGPAYTGARVGVSRAEAAGSHAITDDVVLATQHTGCN